MRVYIMTDLEGISGIVDIAYMDRKSDYYQTARTLLMGDVNAAIAGCFDGGATEVVVKDGHFKGNNFITDRLDPRAVCDKTADPWTGCLDDSFDATLFVGTHAMAGTLDGFLDHTMDPDSWFEYSINGRPVGEIGMWATMAGHFKLPLVYTCGDAAACREAEALIPGIVATAVKTGDGRNNARGMHPLDANAAIRQDVARAISAGKKKFPKPLTWKKPLTLKLVYYRADFGADGCEHRGLTRLDARTVTRQVDNQFDIML